ncbi:tRNA pseudouridine(55) synthase TruB [Actinomyces sp. oral taxon 181]|uniref:tRNA pseudouridine(55) synthase TruB n=1 Tax=Actinomyces sp. oral taxon 181 TaxID=712121 RepID=UPI0025BFDCC7|nr:tRNA pseudouridine(55) synthase TruB [Actinomyces sp. oral taxon 181]MBS5750284.1 tRNA pseudouridine(55) synthase TruB [Actinomyces sp. oral taxon 181]
MTAASTDAVSGLLIVDKPQGITSHDVVSRTRRLAHTRRVGHAGTLDPMATGVLVLGINKATRLLTWITDHSKRYEAQVRFGVETTTEDAEGEVTTARGCEGLGNEEIEAALSRFRGTISQVPSAVSAIKVNGKRAYARVRAGEDVKLEPREVEISLLEAQGQPRSHRVEYVVEGKSAYVDCVDLNVVVECSAGTYIRALARDLGNALGCGAHLISLRRTRVGEFSIDCAHTLQSLDEAAALSGGEAPLPLTSLSEAAREMFPCLLLSEAEAGAFSHGQAPRREASEVVRFVEEYFPGTQPGEQGPIAAYWGDGEVLGLLKIIDNRFATVLVF